SAHPYPLPSLRKPHREFPYPPPGWRCQAAPEPHACGYYFWLFFPIANDTRPVSTLMTRPMPTVCSTLLFPLERSDSAVSFSSMRAKEVGTSERRDTSASRRPRRDSTIERRVSMCVAVVSCARAHA